MGYKTRSICFLPALILLWGAFAYPQLLPRRSEGVRIETQGGLAIDNSGALYFTGKNSVFKLNSDGSTVRIAGNGCEGFSGDGGPATKSLLRRPQELAFDSAGNLYVAEILHVRKITPAGIISTVAGAETPSTRRGSGGSSGEGQPATEAYPLSPKALATDRSGAVYFSDSFRIHRIAPDGIMTTIVGAPGRDAPVTAGESYVAPFDGIAVDRPGNLYFSDGRHLRKRATDGTLTTVAGTDQRGFSGDGGPAASARLGKPNAVAVDGNGNIFVIDSNWRIRTISRDGIITTMAGNGSQGTSGDGGPAQKAQLWLAHRIAVDAAGNVYVADSGIRMITPAGTIHTILAKSAPDDSCPDPDLATAAASPQGIDQFVKRHSGFEWDALWKALGIDGVHLARCESSGNRNCSSEILEVPKTRAKVLVLRDEWDQVAYLRFSNKLSGVATGTWHITGSYQPFLKYFGPEHRIKTIFGRPFLLVKAQGAAGTGVSSALEEWMDLTAPKLDPAFSYMTEGRFHTGRIGFGDPGIEVKGKLLSTGPRPRETIIVQYMIQYSTDEGASLFQRTLSAVYQRNAIGMFVLDQKSSSPGTKQFEEAEEGDGLSRDELLRSAFRPLREIAAGGNAGKRKWLVAFLEGCRNSSEKQQLLGLLHRGG